MLYLLISSFLFLFFSTHFWRDILILFSHWLISLCRSFTSNSYNFFFFIVFYSFFVSPFLSFLFGLFSVTYSPSSSWCCTLSCLSSFLSSSTSLLFKIIILFTLWLITLRPSSISHSYNLFFILFYALFVSPSLVPLRIFSSCSSSSWCCPWSCLSSFLSSSPSIFFIWHHHILLLSFAYLLPHFSTSHSYNLFFILFYSLCVSPSLSLVSLRLSVYHHHVYPLLDAVPRHAFLTFSLHSHTLLTLTYLLKPFFYF